MSYKIQFTDSAKFMASSLSSVVLLTRFLSLTKFLVERIHKFKCNDCDCFLEYESVKCH